MFIVFFAFAHWSNAQLSANNQESDFWDNVRFGGGFGINFGDRFFSGSLSPSAIYQFDSKFASGFGVSASYARQRDVYRSTVLGASILNYYSPIPEIQTSVEFEYLNIDQDFDVINSQDINYWTPALYLGVGYNTGNVIVGVRYDILYDEEDSIYVEPFSPFIRVFF